MNSKEKAIEEQDMNTTIEKLKEQIKQLDDLALKYEKVDFLNVALRCKQMAYDIEVLLLEYELVKSGILLSPK